MDMGGIAASAAPAVVTGALGWFARSGLERIRARRPVFVHVECDVAVIYGSVPDWVGAAYFFDCGVTEVPVDPPATGVEWWKWATANHGVAALFSEIMVTIVSRTAETVVVDGFRGQLVAAEPAPIGSIVVHPVGGADIVKRQASLRFGSMGITSRFIEAGSGQERGGFTFALAAGEPARLSVTGSADEDRYLYRWKGVLDLIVAGRRRSIQISDSGQPFLLHGGGACPHFEWRDGAWAPSAVFKGAG
jgi:hypothetical protein